jgi:hypothetical protein
MFCWELAALFILASYFAYRRTKKEIARLVLKHLGLLNKEE